MVFLHNMICIKLQIEFQCRLNMLTSETNKRKRREESASTGRKAKTRRGRSGKVIRCGLICFYNIKFGTAWSTSSFEHVMCLSFKLGSLASNFVRREPSS